MGKQTLYGAEQGIRLQATASQPRQILLQFWGKTCRSLYLTHGGARKTQNGQSHTNEQAHGIHNTVLAQMQLPSEPTKVLWEAMTSLVLWHLKGESASLHVTMFQQG